MTNPLNGIKRVVLEALEYHSDSTASLFKIFISAVLFQFAVLSLISISAGVKDIPVAENLVQSSHFWWGLTGLFGAASIIFEKYIKGDKAILVLGYLSAIVSFSLLTYDFIASKPPILTGGILATTSAVFLGGLLYGKVKGE